MQAFAFCCFEKRLFFWKRRGSTYVRRICIAVRSLEKASPLARVFVDFLKEWKKKETENAAQR